jgi:hypothetical protein
MLDIILVSMWDSDFSLVVLRSFSRVIFDHVALIIDVGR